MVKIKDLWLESHEFEYNTAEACRGDKCMLNMSRLKHLSAGVELKLVVGAAQESSISLEHDYEITHGHTGRQTGEIFLMNICLIDGLDETWMTTTRHLPNDNPDVLA
ncbi:hypothetical protein TNCV_1956191 [Trichonephila clavipes]|nr:hypothetical protein TNCV_1956191 [Trichonephila clavipes]